MINLPRTEKLIDGEEYFDSSSLFFSHFGGAFSATRCQILKVETRQSYQEPGSPTFDALASGDWDKSMSLLEESRSVDLELYQSLRQRGVDFIRCRPISFPMSDYMRWEMEVYRYNSEHCERIFCCNYDAVDTLFERHIQHDFMVFDSRIAFVHNYNEEGLNVGGWKIENQDKIIQLQSLFIFLKAQCQPFEMFANA